MVAPAAVGRSDVTKAGGLSANKFTAFYDWRSFGRVRHIPGRHPMALKDVPGFRTGKSPGNRISSRFFGQGIPNFRTGGQGFVLSSMTVACRFSGQAFAV